MHVYIYDAFLESSKYSSILAKIETRITDLGLNGKIIRLNQMHNLQKAIKDEAKSGRTVVLVGDDRLFNAAINSLIDTEIVVGFIPVGKNNQIAEAIGIEQEVLACDSLAARRVLLVDLGLANEKAFLTELEFCSKNALIDVGNDFIIEPKNQSIIKIINIPLKNSHSYSKNSPDDNLIELAIETTIKNSLFKKEEKSTSFLQGNNFFINSNEKIKIDQAEIINSPVKVGVAPKALQIIVGKNRNFLK